MGDETRNDEYETNQTQQSDYKKKLKEIEKRNMLKGNGSAAKKEGQASKQRHQVLAGAIGTRSGSVDSFELKSKLDRADKAISQSSTLVKPKDPKSAKDKTSLRGEIVGAHPKKSEEDSKTTNEIQSKLSRVDKIKPVSQGKPHNASIAAKAQVRNGAIGTSHKKEKDEIDMEMSEKIKRTEQITRKK